MEQETKKLQKRFEPYEGYDAAGTQKKINHFLESGTRPINCSTIAEKGFKCPKLESGECDCKAPAAICYKPVSIDGMREIIAELPVAEKSLDNMRTANEFIEEYLYNQDNVIAETIITTELKDHFKFTTIGVRPLIPRYKELAKLYQQGLKARKHKVEAELPLWYVPTEHGLKFMPGVLAEEMKDKEKVLYVNGEYRGESELGKLMHDFNCMEADAVNFELMAERTRYLKENPKGVQEMCKMMEDMRKESLKEVAKRMLADGMLTLEKIAEYAGLSLDEVKKLKADKTF